MVPHLKVNKTHNKSCHKKICNSTIKKQFFKTTFWCISSYYNVHINMNSTAQSYNTTIQICNRKSLLYEEQHCWSLYQGYKNPVIWILYGGTYLSWVLYRELATCQSTVACNFQVACTFTENLWVPALWTAIYCTYFTSYMTCFCYLHQ